MSSIISRQSCSLSFHGNSTFHDYPEIRTTSIPESRFRRLLGWPLGAVLAAAGLAFASIAPGQVRAEECVWTGAVSESFSEAGNWAGFEVPTALDTVVHSNSAGVKRIRVDEDAHVDSLVVIGGGERSLVIDDGCTLVVRKGITNRVSAEYSLTVREIGNLFVGGEVGANVSVDRMRDRIPFDLIAKRAAERQALLESRREAAWRDVVDGVAAELREVRWPAGTKLIGGVPEGGDGVAEVFYIDREGGKRVKATVIARSGDPAPGLPGTFFGILGPPLMRSDGEQAVVSSILFGAINGDSVWCWTRGEGLELVAHKGQQAVGMPPGVTYSWLSDSQIDDSGSISFVGYVSGPGIVGGINDDAAWYGQPGDLQLVAQGGMPVPGAEPGVVIDSGFPFIAWSMSRDGNLVLHQEVIHPRYEPAWGLFLTKQGGPLETVAVTGQTVPEMPGAEVLLASDGRAALGNNGVVFRIQLMGDGINFDNDAGTWLRRSGEFLIFQHEGYPAPGMGDPRITVRVGNSIPEINGLGHSAHGFKIQGPGIDFSNEVVLAGAAIEDFSVFLQDGDPMIAGPTGTFFGVLGHTLIDYDGINSFRAALTGEGVDEFNEVSLYAGPRDSPALLIRNEDPTPDCPLEEVFSLEPPSEGFSNIARNENHQMAISAHFRSKGAEKYLDAVWLHDLIGDEWTRLFSEGELWDGSPAPPSEGGGYFLARSGTGGRSIFLADDGSLGVGLDYSVSDDRSYVVEVIRIHDADEDGDVDLVDFADFQLCFTGPETEAPESCRIAFDSDSDGDIDLADFGSFQLQFTGPS